MTKKKNTKLNSNDLVSYSRAGDTFHYRWAARRCLHLLAFNSSLKYITIEGSNESKLKGEYVIDTAEYSSDEIDGKSVEYFQLKHSTTQCNTNFTLSSLKGTFKGFANRFSDLQQKDHNFASVKFTIISNRQISKGFKKSISKLAAGKSGGVSFDRTIKLYTKLKGKKLQTFCSYLEFVDGEGNYNAQKYSLQREIANLTSESNDVSQMLKLVELVRKRIEPDNKKQVIDKDDVLEQFGLTSEKDLFPAPPLFEVLPTFIEREQYEGLYQLIKDPVSPCIIIGAVAGIGKSITCSLLIDRFKNGSLALAYDCFGNGGYRRISEHRHRACDAYVQISNELAQKGLCEPMLPVSRDQDDRLTKEFLKRLSQAIEKLRESDRDALLVILFDAVDNAEMAAIEFGDRCFASYLLREILPEGCRIVYFARPERVDLFNPPAAIPQISIEPFNNNESLQHLQTKYPKATLEDAVEFRRLTDGNPRVQANALAISKKTVQELLGYFGSGGITVNDLIEEQLNHAINGIKEQYPAVFEQQVVDICAGLASLPPFVPLEVLAAVSNTDISAVKSFISDLGRPLWLTDNYVQFRDEPTETWFTSTYTAKPEQFKTYISRIESLSETFSYVAEALPSLLLKSGQYDRLIKLALSEDKLPTDNPVEARNIQVYRLQFAFKAALKNKQYLDACKLALRAGEEVASSDRQMDILSDNFDLATQFLSPQRLMELAHQRNICGQWNGSETLYSATLLAPMSEYEGEARSYLRSSVHWLNRYFEERKNEDKSSHFNEKLEDNDVLAMFFCRYHLNGYEAAVDFMMGWQPDELIYRVIRMFAGRLVDEDAFEILDQMASYGKNCPSFVIAINHELMKVGKTTNKKTLTRCLNRIVGPRNWLNKPRNHFDSHGISTSAFLSLFEGSIINKLPLANIKRALNYYIDEPSIYSMNENWVDVRRNNYLRSISIRACVTGNYHFTVDEVTPKSWIKDQQSKSYKEEEELKRAKTVLEALLPWYLVRARLLSKKRISVKKHHKISQEKSSRILNNRYQQYDPLPFEITEVRFFNLVLSKGDVDSEITYFIDNLISNSNKFRYLEKINALRAANQNPHLSAITDALEESCYKTSMVIDEDESTIEYANNFISLSRAVLASSLEDAEAYFEKAIEAVSRFGDEVYERWEAVNSIAKQSAIQFKRQPEIAYRFMRCAELIGDTIGREKKWDRDGAMETCFHLSPESAFAIASRWKDREVGRSGRMLSALLESAVSADAISPTSAWAFSALPFDYDLVEFATKCIDKEPNKDKKQSIFNYLIGDYRQSGITGSSWKYINKLGKSQNLHHKALDDLNLLIGETKKNSTSLGINTNISIVEDKKKIESLYGDIDFTSETGLREAYDIFHSIKGIRDFDGLWSYASSQVSSANATRYLSLVASAEFLDLYDIRYALKYFPEYLKIKPSVQKIWPNTIETIVARFPENFIRRYFRESVLGDIGSDDVTINAVREGVLQGLSESSGLESASTFYGFAGTYVQELTSVEASDLLNFALSRFEVHIDDNYSDGCWTPKLSPPDKLIESLTGYVWANLGSPSSSDRWSSMHVVKRFYELGCKDEIDALIKWMLRDHAESFIAKKHPFYNLHAKQYLLMAFARCVVVDANLLIKHHNIFSEIALNGEPHILIQKYAAKIALTIGSVDPLVYEKETIEELKKVGKTPFPIQKSDNHSHKSDTPWHSEGNIDASLEVSFSYDFDSYWLKPLGEVFNVQMSQVQELATKVILSDWKLPFSGEFIRDPRQELWNNRRDRDTWYRHTSYPKIDAYSFYVSYHAMMAVASKLLTAMPIIHLRDWHKNEWQEWLGRHLLVRKDQYWLSDRRDFIPVYRRVLIDENSNSDPDWCWHIWPKDFLDVLFHEQGGKTWLNIAGSWNEYKNNHNEDICISSRLVPNWASSSLQKTIMLNESDIPGHMSLVNFDGKEYEESVDHPFKLRRWYEDNDCLYGIDEFDPYAGDIEYPPFKLDENISSELNISSDFHNRLWSTFEGDVVLESQLWGAGKPLSAYNDIYCKGKRLQASLTFLKSMCESLNSDLVIQVDIKRQLTGVHRDKDNDVGYYPPYRKIYILSKDGKLRDTTTTFELREKIS